MTQRRQYLLFFALIVGVTIGGYMVGRPRRSTSILDAVPHDAWLVVTVDVAALRTSPLAQPLLAAGAGKNVPGLGSITDACGFDPFTRIKQLLVTSPEAGERGDFGVAFSGDFTRDELVKCADKIAHANGGSPATSTRGDYTILENTSDPNHTRGAYRDGGPFLVGRGAWLDAMIDAVDGRAPRQAGEHTALQAALAARPNGPAQTVTLTALLPAPLREKLKADLGAELGADSDKVYVAVLGVSQAGVALRTGAAGSVTELAAELRCETPRACDEIKGLLEHKRLVFSRDIGVRLVGLGPLLDSLKVETHGPSLSASASAPTDDLARAVQRALDFRGLSDHREGVPRDSRGLGGHKPPAAPAPAGSPR